MTQAQAWERQEWETAKAWAAFQIYRDLGKERTIAAVQEFMGAKLSYRKAIDRWVQKNNWKERVRQYDIDGDRLSREALRQAERERYVAKIDEQKASKERLGRALTSVGARILTVLQVQISQRANEQAPMTGGEIASLFKAAITGFQIGLSLIDEVLRIELQELSTTDVEISEELTAQSAEELVSEYFKYINELSIDS